MATTIKVLFVCKGNICRSPAAEAIFLQTVQREGYANIISVDSCGTHGYHVGEPADSRMIAHAAKRGYSLVTLARKFSSKNDFAEFDYIITMDHDNYEHILRLAQNDQEKRKIHPMCRFCSEHREAEVPDPYYEGAEGFEKVLNILEDATKGFLEFVVEMKQLKAK